MSELFSMLLQMHEEFGGNKSRFWKKLCDGGAADDAVILSVVTEALKGKAPGPKNKKKLERLMLAYAQVATVDELRHKYPIYPSWIVSGDRVSSSPLIDLQALTGAWLLVQYRMTKVSARETNPAADLRVGLVMYGSEGLGGKTFDLIGPSTHWRGRVAPRGKQFYYYATEVSREHVREAYYMIMQDVAYPAGDSIDHHGVLLSVAHGPHEGSTDPVVASRVLLWKIQRRDFAPQVPKTNEHFKQLRVHLGYVEANTFAGIEDETLATERGAAIRRFLDRQEAPENLGDRILVRW